MQNRKLMVIDAMPGAGKTELFIEQAIKLIKNKDNSKILVYCAPTRFLIEEVIERLKQKSGMEPRTQSYLGRTNYFFDQTKVYSAYGLGRIRIKGLLSSLFGFTSKYKVECAAPGSIILMTHEGLLRVPKLSKFSPPSLDLEAKNPVQNYARVLNSYNEKVHKHKIALSKATNSVVDQCELYFDEARQCVLTSNSLELSRYHVHQLLACPLITWTSAERNSKTDQLVLEEIQNLAYSKRGMTVEEAEELATRALQHTVSSKPIVEPPKRRKNQKPIPIKPTPYDLVPLGIPEDPSIKDLCRKELTEAEAKATYYWTPVTCCTVKQFAKHWGYAHLKDMPAGLRKFFRTWATCGDGGRGEIILAGNFDVVYTDRDNDSANGERNVIMTLIVNPSSLFESFRKQRLMSAFFKDSQMYHMLQRDYYGFDFILQNPKSKLTNSLANIAKRDEALRAKLLEKINFGFLIDKNPKAKKDYNVLSSYMLNRRVLLPFEFVNEVQDIANNFRDHRGKKAEADIVFEDLGTRRTFGEIFDEEFRAKVNKYCLPPLITLAKQSYLIARRWAKANHVLSKEKGKGLLVVLTNSPRLGGNTIRSSQEYAPSGVLPLRMLHLGEAVERVTRKLNSEQQERSDRYKAELEWCNRVVGTEMQIPEQTKLHGLNSYTDFSVFAHLAALNLPPELNAMLSSILPNYNSHQDNVIENLVQTLYRTQLRSLRTEHNDKVLLICAYFSTALMLCKKLGMKDEDKAAAFLRERTFAQPEFMLPYYTSEDEEERKELGRQCGLGNRKYRVEGQSAYVRKLQMRKASAERRGLVIQLDLYDKAIAAAKRAKTKEQLLSIELKLKQLLTKAKPTKLRFEINETRC